MRAPLAYDTPARVLPRQAGRCLAYVAGHPGSSGTEVQAALGIRHLSQASRILIRLEQRGLAYTNRSCGAPSAWRLTAKGRALLDELPGGLYD